MLSVLEPSWSFIDIKHRRKGVGEQAQEKLKPDSQKTYTEVASDTATGIADKAAAAVQPSRFLIPILVMSPAQTHIASEKSTTQKISDSARGGVDGAQDTGTSYVDQAKNLASGAANTASEYIDSANRSIFDIVNSASQFSICTSLRLQR